MALTGFADAGRILHGAGLLQGIFRTLYLAGHWPCQLPMAGHGDLGASLFMRIDGLLFILLPAAALVTLLAGVFRRGMSCPTLKAMAAHPPSDCLYRLRPDSGCALHAILMAAPIASCTSQSVT